MNIITKLRLFNNLLNNEISHARRQEDIYCLQLINKILHEGDFIPFTSMSLRPYVLAFMMNEVIINNRRKIIEFGSGISTIMLARLAKKLNFQHVIISVEENQEWIKVIQQILNSEGLQDRIKIIYAPVEERMIEGKANHWYKNELLAESLKPYDSFDMVMIDGPTAFNEQIAHSRYFAVPFLDKFLLNDHVILLDDANRKGEQQIMHLWKKEQGKAFMVYAETLGVFYQGQHFESNPMKLAMVRK